MRRSLASRLVPVAGLGIALWSAPAMAATEGKQPERLEWSFNGPFGRFDQAQLQRGFKVYREVCSSCHSMKLIAFRNLGDPGGPSFTEAQVKAIAAEYKIAGGVDDNGDPMERPARPSDAFPGPYQNEQQARAANGGALPPDMSVIAKARGHGTDYLHALLIGYRDPPPPDVEPQEGKYYNDYFPGGWISMPPPISDGQVEYTDGTATTVDQYAKDVSAFLMWAAEPKLEERKRMGFQAVIFLGVFAGLLGYTWRTVWRDVEH